MTDDVRATLGRCEDVKPPRREVHIFQLTRGLLDYRFTLLNLGVYCPFRP